MKIQSGAGFLLCLVGYRLFVKKSSSICVPDAVSKLFFPRQREKGKPTLAKSFSPGLFSTKTMDDDVGSSSYSLFKYYYYTYYSKSTPNMYTEIVE